jgi:hypothetical protein
MPGQVCSTSYDVAAGGEHCASFAECVVCMAATTNAVTSLLPGLRPVASGRERERATSAAVPAATRSALPVQLRSVKCVRSLSTRPPHRP